MNAQEPCQNCTVAAARPKTKPAWCGYSLWCIHCCARLVASARPLRYQQEALLAAIARNPDAPSRADILQALKRVAR